MSRKTLRICVCTTVEGAAEPRAPRHAAWIAWLGPDYEVTFIDCAPVGSAVRPVKALEGWRNLTWASHRFATRASSPARLALDRLRQRAAQWSFKATGNVNAGALSTRMFGMERALENAAADVYLAHNIESLLPAWNVARRRHALLMFDSMEFHSDMGDAQTPGERTMVRTIERLCLPDCALVLAASDQIADALVAEYGIQRPVPLYNVPDVEASLPDKPTQGLALYWRNAVIGLGQRGLDEALVALTQLPADVTLHLQGRQPPDGGNELKRRIAELGVASRVFFHPPYAPENAVKEAARHHVGLCLERKCNRNHDLTVSNKIFDYHMAGLAIIASDLPGLAGVVTRSQGGLSFQPGSAQDLTAQIARLYHDGTLRLSLAANARNFALNTGNRDVEKQKMVQAFIAACGRLKAN